MGIIHRPTDPVNQSRAIVKSPLDAKNDGRPVFQLTELSGVEGMSRLFSFQLQLLAERRQVIAFDQILGQSITVTLAGQSDAEDRYFNGMCCRLSQGRSDGAYTAFDMEIVPAAWLLTRKAQSRVYQHLSVPQILAEVLKPIHGLPFADVDFTSLGSGFEERDYCVQYRETDFSFACRLMEEEGISYFFEHSNGKHIMRLATPESLRGSSKLRDATYRSEDGGPAELYIDSWEKSQQLRSGKYVLWDHHFELTGKNLAAEKTMAQAVGATSISVGRVSHLLSLPGSDKLELYDFPGEYAQRYDGVYRQGGAQPQELDKIPEDSQRTTKIRMQQEAVSALVVQGSSNRWDFAAGSRIAVSTLSHDLAAHAMGMEGQYLLTAISHSCSQGTSSWHYSNRFECIPVAMPFRPVRVTPKPIVMGTQTATVVGVDKDQEIFVDQYGRVKVQFHWDRLGQRNADSSCWVRVAQLWAGKRWGASFWPRVGQEVVVAFEEGDPDQPIIIGSVYNDKQQPPYLFDGLDSKHKNDPRISGIKTCSTPNGGGYHEIRFDDTKGKEQLFLRSQGALDIRALGGERITIGGDSDLIVGGSARELTRKDRDVHVLGDMMTQVDQECRFDVKGDYHHSVEGEMTCSVKNSISIAAAQLLKLWGQTELHLICGASSIKMTSAGIWINAPTVNINSGSAPTTLETLPADDKEIRDPVAADESKSGLPSNK
jgi:type VI secretion system secreted protein VgrG